MCQKEAREKGKVRGKGEASHFIFYPLLGRDEGNLAQLCFCVSVGSMPFNLLNHRYKNCAN